MIKTITRLAMLAAVLACAGFAPPLKPVVETWPNRADLVSGGDVMLRISPMPTRLDDVQILLNDHPLSVSSLGLENDQIVIRSHCTAPCLAIARGSDDNRGYVRLDGLRDGKNLIRVTIDGQASTLQVINHPNGGPLFSGPQIEPWTCKPGASDAQCNRPTTYSWAYMPKGGTALKAYDPKMGAKDVETIVTSDGVTIPYIVRIESLTQNRSGVSVATLFDPARPWTPLIPQKQWNKGVIVLQGSGCGTGYGEQPAGDPLNDKALRKGLMVVTVALLHNTINCNPVVQAEAALMAREHVAETYGPYDLIFGMGSSGGAISQIMDQNAYPGLYDGLILNHLFADSDASRKAAYDCMLVGEYWKSPGALPYTEAQKVAVTGMQSGCASAPTRYEIYSPSIGTGCDVPADAKFDPVKNPKGVRCTLQDYEVNQVGRRPDGAAYGRLDTEGVQYGLKALKAGTITPAQFAEMNAAIKGHDINFKPIPTRTRADVAGLPALYSTGLNNTENNLATTPIIETRLQATDFHQVFHHTMVLARLDRAQGHHDNYVTWRTTAARDASFDQAMDVMITWIKAIKADKRGVPQAQRVIDNKPDAARERCTNGDGKDQLAGACPRPLELTRVLAGAPDTNDMGKCVLKRLNRKDYGGLNFSEAEWATLKQTFATGVCDYSKPPVGFRMSVPWQTYSSGKGGKAMGAAPTSR